MSFDKELVDKITNFLNGIGIPVIEEVIDYKTFLPGLHFKEGSILMDIHKMKYPGDLLHEAGHIAVTEERLRPFIGTSKIGKEWPSLGDEMVSILWSYAALHHLELDPEIVFHPDGYKGSSEWLIEQFNNKTYIGMPLFIWMGFVDEERQFPILKKWLRGNLEVSDSL